MRRTLPPAILLAIGAYFGFVVAVAQFHGVTAFSLGLPSGVIATLAAGCGVAGAIWFLFANDQLDSWRPPQILIGLALLCLISGSYYGLFVAPPEQFMGDVQRIMYVHVPTAWNALLAMTLAFACAVIFLFRGDYKWDSRMEGSIESGVVLAFLLCCQGAIWAKPTWGVWWDWDPRLTTTAVLLFAFLGILALRKFVEDPARRAIWSAVATIIAYVDVPIVYFSVRWWNSLHQQQSSPGTVSKQFWLPLRLNAFGILFLMVAFIMLRARLASLRLKQEMAPPLPEMAELGEAV
jgi:heme exporter protein C